MRSGGPDGQCHSKPLKCWFIDGMRSEARHSKFISPRQVGTANASFLPLADRSDGAEQPSHCSYSFIAQYFIGIIVGRSTTLLPGPCLKKYVEKFQIFPERYR